MGWPEEAGFGSRADGQLRRVRFADDDQARPLVPLDQLAVLIRHEILQERGALGKAEPCVLGEEVFQQERRPSKGSVGERARCHLAGVLVHPGYDCVQGRVQALDALDRRVHELDRLDLALSDQLCLAR